MNEGAGLVDADPSARVTDKQPDNNMNRYPILIIATAAFVLSIVEPACAGIEKATNPAVEEKLPDKGPLIPLKLLTEFFEDAHRQAGRSHDEGLLANEAKSNNKKETSLPGQAAATEMSLQITPAGKISVIDFGAKGDDKTDDLAAFERATAALQPWQTLYVPPGAYRLSGKWLIKNKYRVKIECDGVIKPKPPYSDYLVEFNNDENDPISKSMGQQIVVRGLTVDGEWKSRGIKISHAWDSSFENIHVWRPYGHGLYTPMLQEVSFYKPVIFMGKPRKVKADTAASDIYDVAQDWNASVTHSKGEYVRTPSTAFDVRARYRKGDIVNSGGFLYRAIRKDDSGKLPSLNADNWERVSHAFYVATGLAGNKNKNPEDGKVDYTTRARKEGSKYWIPVYADEAAWEMVGDGPKSTIDNVKVWNFISRSNAQNTIVRIDNPQYTLPVSQVEFHAAQLHAITKQYISAFNSDNRLIRQGAYNSRVMEPPMATLVHAASTTGLKFIGGQLRTANMSWAKGLVVGGFGVSGNAARTFLSSVSINGDGDYGVGISVMPSVETYGGNNWLESNLEMHMGGLNSAEKVDLHGKTQTMQSGTVVIPKGATYHTVHFDPPLMGVPTVNLTPISDSGGNPAAGGRLGGLSWQLESISKEGYTIRLTGGYIGEAQTAKFTARGGNNQQSSWVHNYELKHSAIGIGAFDPDPGEGFRMVGIGDSANELKVIAPRAPVADTAVQYWGIWQDNAPVPLKFNWSAKVEPH